MSEAGAETGGSFEALLATIAARLLGEPAAAFDACIADALSRMVQFLEVERSVFAVVDPDGVLRSTHAAAVSGVTPFPVERTVGDDVPWIFEQLNKQRVPVIVSSASDLPPGATVDAETFRVFAVRSVAVFPIVAGDRLLGAFSFGATQKERPWPRPLVERIRLISEIFAAALLRREHEARLREALGELEMLRERLQLENDYLRQRSVHAEGFEDIVGESGALRSALFRVEQVAPTDTTVLLLGETGTGKELIARAIHARSARRDRTLVTVNCAALSPTLIESELFGHEKGAFTGAVARKIGRFELASGSTLFLDEVGEIPLGLQAKLLRVLQEGEFERLGSSATHKVDVRVIAASNRDLAAAAREGTFRADLYYRLGVFPIRVPALRARKADIPLLVWYFLGQLGGTLGKRIERVPGAAMDRLLAYDWPGNIRELKNVLERAVILSPGPVLLLDEVTDDARISAAPTTGAGSVRPLVEVEREHILRVMESCDWRVRGPESAAKLLGINASTLYSRMKKLGIRRSSAPPDRQTRA